MKNKSIILLILVMSLIAISASGVAISMLYNTSIQQQAIRLVETAQSQARLLEAVARFDARFSAEDVPGGAFAATLQQIRDAHELFNGFGETGEFTLAKLEDDQMVYLLSPRLLSPSQSDVSPNPLSIPLHGKLAEPMQQALLGHSGTIIGTDYRGKRVLAAFEPVAELNIGIVAKINLSEIRRPFLNAAITVIFVTLILVFIGTFLVHKIGNPLIRRIEENEQRLRSILNTAADGIITLDEKGIIHSFNQAAEKIFGYSAEEANGRNIAELILEPYPFPRSENSIPVEEQNLGAERELTALHKNGSRIPVEITISEVREQDTRIITSIIRNITERKQSLMALHQREEELRLTFENTPAGIYICTLEGRILRANHAFCSLLNRSEQELTGCFHSNFIFQDDLKKIKAHEHQLLDDKLNSDALDINFVGPNGNKIPCKFRSSAILDEKGTPQLCIVHIEDLSEHLKNERLISEHRERLAQVTRLSTLGEMAASIAHEINQPLSAIATYATACQRLTENPDLDQAEVSKTLNKIQNQALRAGDVIHRLREFIRNRKTHKEQVSCHTLINGVIDLAEMHAQNHQVSIHKSLQTGLPLIYVDVVQIQQVILNLLRNAIESMEQISPTENKTVGLEVKCTEAKHIEFSVIDQGLEPTEETLSEMFTPFFTSKPLGMGLGLPICRSIISAHGGQLNYVRNPIGGSIFRFTLPLIRREENQV